MPNLGAESLSKLKVLFVDDDVVMQKLLSSALQKVFDVISETSGAMVVEHAEKVSPDVILLDLSMPNVDGFEVLARLKRHPVLANIPVICVSGKLDEESRTRAYRAGAAGFMGKPIDVVRVGKDIEHLLKSMNTEVLSFDERRAVFIGRNAHTAAERMKAEMLSTMSKEKNALVMSINNGDAFFKTFDSGYLKAGRVAYFEIKPALIVRLPYLEDLSSIEEDVRTLLPKPNEPYELFFEGPEQILNILDQEKSAATIISFSEALAKIFPKVHYYSRYTDDELMNRHINGMAKLLARV